MELSDSFPRDAKGVQGFDVDMVDDVPNECSGVPISKHMRWFYVLGWLVLLVLLVDTHQTEFTHPPWGS